MTWSGPVLTLAVSGDLGGDVEVSSLRAVIEPLAASLLTGPSQSGGVVTASFAPEPSQAERDAIDAAVVTYAEGALGRAKLARRAVHSDEFRAMIFRHYEQPQQTSLALYRSEAKFDGLVNRANYIGQALGWVEACFTAHDAKDDEIDAQVTVSAVEAVTWDYSGLEAADPEITLRTARGILD